MIVRLWALAWAVRYLKYVPILGWRFSENIVQRIEDRMDRDVEIEQVHLEPADDAPPTAVDVSIDLANELPVDLSVTAVNVRFGYVEDAATVANVTWDDDAHGSEPRNVETAFVESDATGTVRVERYLPAARDPTSNADGDATEDGTPAAETDAASDEHAPDAIYVDGTITTTAWLDVPSTKRIPLGDIDCELPDASVTFDEAAADGERSGADDEAGAVADGDDEDDHVESIPRRAAGSTDVSPDDHGEDDASERDARSPRP